MSLQRSLGSLANRLRVKSNLSDVDDRQEALNTLTDVDNANDGDVLIKDAVTGDAIFKAPATYVQANGVTLNAGSSSDTVADVQAPLDGNTYTIVEATGAPGMNLEIDFIGVTKISRIAVSAYYDGSSAHAVRIQLYNYTDTAWDTMHTMNDGRDYEQHFKTVLDDSDYISGGAAIIRLYHTESGNASHDLHVDYVGLVSAG